MKRFMMDSQAPRGLGGRRAGRGNARSLGQGRGGRQRQQRECQGLFSRFRLAGASANDGFAGFCIERLQSRIERLQARLAQLMAQAGK